MIQKILKNSKRFQKIPKESERFQKVPKVSKRLQKIAKDSKKFQKIPKESKRFKNSKELINKQYIKLKEPGGAQKANGSAFLLPQRIKD